MTTTGSNPITPYETSQRLRHQLTARRLRGQVTTRPAVTLAGLSVVEGGDAIPQLEILERLGLADDEFARGIFERSGIERRHLNLEPGFLAKNLQGRTQEVEDDLLRQAIAAIDQLDIRLETVGTLLTSSLYSMGTPSLAQRLIDHYGMPPSTDKYHITGVGCSSAVPLFRLAGQLVQANPTRSVLVVAAESMSSILMPGGPEDPKVKTVGSAIFGDGCAAALISGEHEAEGPAILATAVHQIAGTLDVVHLTASAEDSHLDLGKDLPEIATEELAELVDCFLEENHLGREHVDHWMIHPGGRRIVERARDALGLDDEDVAVSWRNLANHGNVGTPSIFYVIDSTIAERRPEAGDHGLAITIGPGVSLGLMLVRF